MAKIIAVIGATGVQGGSVISTILKNGTYKIRGITRNPNGEKAKNLAAQGVEIVKADINDESSLVKAFEGASAIYAVTDFFEPFASKGAEHAIETEFTQGVNIAKAASKTETLEHFIWSTLPNSSKISDGKFLVPHFEAKNRVDDFIKADKILLEKTTFLWISFYASNLLYPLFTPNLVKSSGKYAWLLPSPSETPITIVGDTAMNVGPFVSAILAQPELTLGGKFVLATSETSTNGDVLRTWSKVTGKQAEYVQISLADYDHMWPGWGQEMGVMLKLWEALGDKSWSGEPYLLKEDLGVKSSDLVGLEAAFASIDWASVL